MSKKDNSFNYDEMVGFIMRVSDERLTYKQVESVLENREMFIEHKLNDSKDSTSN